MFPFSCPAATHNDSVPSKVETGLTHMALMMEDSEQCRDGKKPSEFGMGCSRMPVDLPRD